MARPFAFLMALVVLNYWSTCCLGCDLRQTYTHMKNKILNPLDELKRPSLVSCLKDRKDFAFPLKKVDAQHIQKAQAISFLQGLAQQVLTLLVPMDSSHVWEKKVLETFLSDLNDQLKLLTTCQGMGDSQVTVNDYFHRITVYLKEKKYSPCAWEVVRAEIWRALTFLNNLLPIFAEKKEALTKMERTLLS
ncbi:interferon alpha-9-like [Phodopus roborovskii]|uniref:interferon alpha-9-like n=1 Tax=Phodopus roborovskii TaxID=109678 RepID=UPI0021E4CFC5|nr:interferon alpha-9-like [Phodopus roborovskii]